MQDLNETEVRTPTLFLAKKGKCFMSPNLLSADPGIDTPNKIPAAPHPSPMNMVIGQLNPESKEIFRKQLLKACQLKIPEAIENLSNFDESIQANLSYTEVASPICKHIFNSLDKKEEENVSCGSEISKISDIDKNAMDENSIFKDLLPPTEDCSIKFDYDFVKIKKSLSELPQITFTVENGKINSSDKNAENDSLHASSDSKNFKLDDELIHCEISTLNENDLILTKGDTYPDFTNLLQTKAELVDFPHVLKSDKLSTIEPINDGKDPSSFLNSISGQNLSVFYNPNNNFVDLSPLLDSNNEWNDSSSYRSRSPCSDKLSTVAQCASEASDISDIGEFEEEFEISKDLGSFMEIRSNSFGSSKDFGSVKDYRPKKKSSGNLVIRSFLRWRRSFKMRKRAESLDESKFPFLANRFGSYKTEFELSV